MCVKDTLFNIYYWFINTELTATSTINHALRKLKHTHFLHKAHHDLLALSTRQHFSSVLAEPF